jgi:hypothetical protein
MAITEEEFKEFIQDENNKGLFDEVARAYGYKTEDDIQGLKNKNYELLGKLKTIKTEKEEVQKQLDNIDINGYNDYVSKSSSGKDKSDKSDRELTRIKEALKEKEESYKALERDLNDNLISSSLSKVFDQIKVDPKHKELLSSAYKGKAIVEVDGKERQVVIQNGDGLGLPAKEYFQKWAESDQGKEYLIKPDNSGANSRGFSQGGSRTMKKAEFDKLPPAEKVQMAKKVSANELSIVD